MHYQKSFGIGPRKSLSPMLAEEVHVILFLLALVSAFDHMCLIGISLYWLETHRTYLVMLSPAWAKDVRRLSLMSSTTAARSIKYKKNF